MTDRNNAIAFTRGLMDRLRECAEMSQIPTIGKWEVVGDHWLFDGGFCSAIVKPIKFIHYPNQAWFQVSFSDKSSGKYEVVGSFETFEIAQDHAESFVLTCLRGILITPQEIATKRIE